MRQPRTARRLAASSRVSPELPIPDPALAAAAARRRHWRGNVLLVAVLLVLWALVGLGCGVLWADTLDRWRLGGFPLGFWFAQQGSILAFVLLILAYALVAGRRDRRLRAELAALRDSGG
jgi:putative solute:sodium symporter small subunit